MRVRLLRSYPLILLGESNAQTDTERDGKDDEYNNKEAPPLELLASARVVCRNFDFFIALLDVFDSLFGVLLGGLDDRFLLLDNSGQFLEELAKLHHGLLNALQLAVTGSDVAQNSVGVACPIGFELVKSLVYSAEEPTKIGHKQC